MRLQFLGAAGTVTGSCFLVETAGMRVMVDCGLFQGSKEIRERNYGNFPVSPRTVDYLLLTHAHIDHSGLIPKLVKHGFRGQICATGATVDLCAVLLPDSGHIQEMEVERKNRKARRSNLPLIEPIYNIDDAYRSLSYFRRYNYNEVFPLAPGVRARFADAGHILGSAMIELWVEEDGAMTKLVFSGDIGNDDQPIVNDPSAIAEADCVIMESTYGDRLHKQCADELELLHDIIMETYRKGGNLVIPAFAVERTQDLLYHLSLLIEEKRMPPMTVYIDSPLAIAATAIFRRNRQCFDQETCDFLERGNDPFGLPEFKFTKTTEESRALNEIKGGAIIISASGMCEAGRIRHHLKHNLWRPESTVLFVGYQAQGTLGRQILDGSKNVRIFGEEIAVQADIRLMECYSAHADQQGLMKWVRKFNPVPRRIFVAHGEPEAAGVLAGLINAELGPVAAVPAWLESVDLKAEAGGLESAYDLLVNKLKHFRLEGVKAGKQDELLQRMSEFAAYLDGLGA
ncbi:MAG: MBL fold metallo-hydrolase [Peptococcaceae bacterium]|nr:MAG: MBL fold metallo-hydrolase [Peptococcaceae bacterium]